MSTDANNNAKTMTPKATAQKAAAASNTNATTGNTNTAAGKDNRGLECRHCGRRMTTWERPIGA